MREGQRTLTPKAASAQLKAAENARRNADAPGIPATMREFWLAVAREHEKAAQPRENPTAKWLREDRGSYWS